MELSPPLIKAFGRSVAGWFWKFVSGSVGLCSGGTWKIGRSILDGGCVILLFAVGTIREHY